MNRLKEYLKNVDGVSHITFDPYGPGVARVFLIPPKKPKMGIAWTIIINGESILPICMGWAILLREFINEINKYSGKSITEDDIELASKNTVKNVKEIFPKTKEEMLKKDLKDIIDVLLKISRHEEVEDIGYLSLKKYAKYLNAPHRVDLMISAMERDGHWACNQKCLNCYAADQVKANDKELSTEEWKNLISKLREAMVPQITFTGGEPTMRDDLVELVSFASWFVTRLNTNGQRLTKELCKELAEASLDAVQVTFYSHKKEIHNMLVGVDGFDKTCAGIKNALEAGLVVSINTPLCELNKDYVETIKYASKELGVRYFTCSGLILTGNATYEVSYNSRLNGDELKQILVEAINYCHENDLEIKFTSPGWIDEEFFKANKLNPPMCGACISNMAITPGGDLVPCQSWLNGETFGNLCERSFSSIWEGKALNAFRKKNIKTDFECPLNEMRLDYEKKNW